MNWPWHKRASSAAPPFPPPASGADAPPAKRLAPPFVLEERLEEVQTSGSFTPRCALWLSASFAQSGLLRDLADEELYLLLAVLSCLSPNGAFLATPERVAEAVGASPRAALQGLEGLCERAWRGQPLLRSHTTASGLRFFSPSPHLLEVRRGVVTPAPPGGQRVAASQEAQGRPAARSAVREEVVAHSRARYARPRAQVEAEIEAFLRSGRGLIKVRTPPAWEAAGQAEMPITEEQPQISDGEEAPSPETAVTPQARQWLHLKRALVEAGVPQHRADELLDLYPPERIERQIRWLPLRQARSPVAYLLAAIERDYAPPSGLAPSKAGQADEPPPSASTPEEPHEP